MTKKTRQAVDRAPKSGPGAKRGKRTAEKRTMLSIRLNERERALLTEAASFREQAPTGFIKSAAISHAAHVVNTSKKTTFDFGAIESAVATLLFTYAFDREYRTKYLPNYQPTLLQTSPTDPEKTVEYPALPSFEVLTYRGAEEEEAEYYDGTAGVGTGTNALPERWVSLDPEMYRPPAEFTKSELTEADFNDPFYCAPIIRDNRVPMTKNDFLQLQRAVRLGGTEFLQRILRIGAKRYFGDEDIDEPIDPQSID